MIDFECFQKIKFLHHQEKLTRQQIAKKLSLDSKTVSKWLGLWIP
jgi:DNA-binding transcriptional regulator LsrR (DeoR family)